MLRFQTDMLVGPGRVMLIPDPHVGPSRDPTLFVQTIDYVLSSAPQLVVFLGDLVQDASPESWGMVAAQVARLTAAGIPWVPLTGNHDYDPLAARTTLINNYLSVPPWFTGVYQPGHVENSYSVVTLGRRQWLVLALEWSPRTAVVAWANTVVQSFPNLPVILVTHCYLYYTSERYNWSVYGDAQGGSPYSTVLQTTPAEGISDGEDLWKNLVRDNSNIKLVLCGHCSLNTGVSPTAAYLKSTRGDGSDCYQVLQVYQDTVPSGSGCAVDVRLDYANHALTMRTFSTYYGDWILTPLININLPL